MCETGCSRQQVSRSVCVWNTAGMAAEGVGEKRRVEGRRTESKGSEEIATEEGAISI